MRSITPLLIALTALGADGQTSPNPCAETGINLSGLASWTSSWPFVDSFKIRRPWISGALDGSAWDDGRSVATDAEGWVTSLLPNQRAHTLIHDNAGGHYPAGRYVCLFEGQGLLHITADAQIVSQSPGRIEFDITTPSDSGIWFQINATDPQDYIRNIQIIMPGFEPTYQTQQFHPEFLDSLRSFDVIRFMDWQNTNSTYNHSWAQRPKPADGGYALGLGVPIEVMADLCNQLDADPWFCMSHRFDDQYVDQFATLLHAHLDPDRTVYVEHSNEVWNSIFNQYHYAVQRSSELGIPGDPFQAAMRFHSQRSVEIFDIWDNYFQPDHLVRVMGGWHANTWATNQLLDWNNAHLHTDAFATAPYFGNYLGVGNNPNQTLQMTPDEIIDACIADIAVQNQQSIDQFNAVNPYDLDLIAYESGQHLVGVGNWTNNTQLTSLFIAANRHPRMYDAYVNDISGWNRIGGGLMTAFASCNTPTRYGSWGLLEFQDQPLSQAPKMRAWSDYNTDPADFNQDGQLDFFDISAFLTAYSAADPAADLSGDSILDFFDISILLQAFASECP